MRNNPLIWFLAVCLLSGGLSGLSAQDKKTLEANKKKVEQEIAQTSKLLEQTRKNKRNSLAELELLNKNISMRTKLIKGLNQEVTLTDQRIGKLTSDIARHTRDIENLKKEYAAMLQSSYLHRSQYDKWMFILASSDFNQALRRLQYIKQYGDHQRLTVAQIEAKQAALEEKRVELTAQRAEKKQLLDKQEKEKGKLQKEKTTQNKLVNTLKKKENQLAAQLKAKQKKRNELNAQIQKIIQEEIRKSNEAAQKESGGFGAENDDFGSRLCADAGGKSPFGRLREQPGQIAVAYRQGQHLQLVRHASASGGQECDGNQQRHRHHYRGPVAGPRRIQRRGQQCGHDLRPQVRYDTARRLYHGLFQPRSGVGQEGRQGNDQTDDRPCGDESGGRQNGIAVPGLERRNEDGSGPVVGAVGEIY